MRDQRIIEYHNKIDGYLPMQDSALKTADAASYLGLKPKTLENWRVMGIGPAFQKGPGLRGSIRYPLSSLYEWRSRHLQTSTSQTMVGVA